MRGKRRRFRSRSHAEGLIPACAGKTFRARVAGNDARAHPRVCGENAAALDGGTAREGSSPRMRGKHQRPNRRRPRIRLIPAYAGKTAVGSLGVVRVRAHPRVCGENVAYEKAVRGDLGSSPRMRGKLRLVWVISWPWGLIPAYAGKTTPRRRTIRMHCGSSPRMRGKQTKASQTPSSARLIPAYAGKTFSRSFMMSRRSAHPRVCGENEARAGPKTPPQGSSPRMRGKRGRLARSRRARGLIPAYAGKTLSGG